MGKAYSLDLRRRIVDYISSGHTRRQAARVYGVSVSTAVRLAMADRDHGDIRPKRQGRSPGTTGKLFPHMDYLRTMVEENPDITLQELADSLKERRHVTVVVSSIHHALIRCGLSYKKRISNLRSQIE